MVILGGMGLLHKFAADCALIFLLAIRNVCRVTWSEVVLLKFRLKDKSSLVSLEGDKVQEAEL